MRRRSSFFFPMDGVVAQSGSTPEVHLKECDLGKRDYYHDHRGASREKTIFPETHSQHDNRSEMESSVLPTENSFSFLSSREIMEGSFHEAVIDGNKNSAPNANTSVARNANRSHGSSSYFSEEAKSLRKVNDNENHADEDFSLFSGPPLLTIFAFEQRHQQRMPYSFPLSLSATVASRQLRLLFPFLSLLDFPSATSLSTSETSKEGCTVRVSSSTVTPSDTASFETLWNHLPRVLCGMLSDLSEGVKARMTILSEEEKCARNTVDVVDNQRDAPYSRKEPHESLHFRKTGNSNPNVSITSPPPSLSPKQDHLKSASFPPFSFCASDSFGSKHSHSNWSSLMRAQEHQCHYDITASITSWIKLLECILLDATSPASGERKSKRRVNATPKTSLKNRNASHEFPAKEKGRQKHVATEGTPTMCNAPLSVIFQLSQQLIWTLEFLFSSLQWSSYRSCREIREKQWPEHLDGPPPTVIKRWEEPGTTMKALIEDLLLECMMKVMAVAAHDAVAPLVAGLQVMAKNGDLNSIPRTLPCLCAETSTTRCHTSWSQCHHTPRLYSIESSPEESCPATLNDSQAKETHHSVFSNHERETQWVRTKRWHSFVTPELVFHVSQRVLTAVKAVKQHPAMLQTSPTYSLFSDARRREEESVGVSDNACPRDVSLHSLHQCVLCPFQAEWGDWEEEKDGKMTLLGSIAVTTMACMRFARVVDLMGLSRYLDSQRRCKDSAFSSFSLARTAVYTKFLANCGTAVWAPCGSGGRANVTSGRTIAAADVDPSQGLQKRVEDSFYPPSLFSSLLQMIHTALDHLTLEKAGSIKDVEEGLVHGCAALHSLGDSAHVRQVYRSLPELRETASSVASLVALGDCSGALESLAKLGYSQSSGWVYIPAVVAETILSVSFLVGCKGTTKNVEELYRALIAFQNKGMLMANYMEAVLRGVARRMMHYPAPSTPSSPSSPTFTSPASLSLRQVVSDVIPMVEVTLQMLGDDVNADVILSLVESAVRWTATAFTVPLTVNLVAVLRRVAPQHISLLSFFTRLDSTTNNMPFLQYYVLCTIRDGRRVGKKEEGDEIFDHLASIWGVDGTAIRRRSSFLSPPYKLWRCCGCGRPNSDRFNFCACSALRNLFIVCPSCGYGQDERWPVCLSCGEDTSAPSGAVTARAIVIDERRSQSSSALCRTQSDVPSVVRKSWSCPACGATNPARQVLLCFRCSKLTGPLAELQRQQKKGKPEDARTSSSCSLPSSCAASPSSPDTVRKECSLVLDENASSSSFCQCTYGTYGKTTYSTCIGFCHRCRTYRNRHSQSTSFAWRCMNCQQLRSSLERSCPRCPHVECVPFLFSHAVEDSRYCSHCHHECTDPFLDHCSSCGKKNCLEVSLPTATTTTSGTASEEQWKSGANTSFCRHCHGALDEWTKSILCPHCLRRVAAAPSPPFVAHSASGTPLPTNDSALPSFTDPEVVHQTFAAMTSFLLRLASSSLPLVTAVVSPNKGETSWPECAKAEIPQNGALGKRGEDSVLSFSVVDSEAVERDLRGVVEFLEMIKEYFFSFSNSCENPAMKNNVLSSEEDYSAHGTGERQCVTFSSTVPELRGPHFLSSTENNTSSASSGIPPKASLLTVDQERVHRSANETLKLLSPHIATSLLSRRAAAHLQQLLATFTRSMIPPASRVHCRSRSESSTTAMPLTSMVSFPTQSDTVTESGVESLATSCGELPETEDVMFSQSSTKKAEPQCTLCLGSHPEELCAFSRAPWFCEACGDENSNTAANLSRYCCMSCLTLRPAVRQMQPSTCWNCRFCLRSNVCFEKYCIFCGREDALRTNDDHSTSLLQSSCSSPWDECSTTPFLPARCAICLLVYLEPACPSCSSRVHDDSCQENVSDNVSKITAYTAIDEEEQRGEGTPLHSFCAVSPSLSSRSSLCTTSNFATISKKPQTFDSTPISDASPKHFASLYPPP